MRVALMGCVASVWDDWIVLLRQENLPFCFLQCATVSKVPVLCSDAQIGRSYLCHFTLVAERKQWIVRLKVSKKKNLKMATTAITIDSISTNSTWALLSLIIAHSNWACISGLLPPNRSQGESRGFETCVSISQGSKIFLYNCKD
jgi:hypothetical protein